MAVLLGRTSAGTSASFISAGDSGGWKYTASASGQLVTLFFQSKVDNSGAPTTSVELGVYTDSANKPGTKLGSTVNSTSAVINATTVWSVTLSPTVTIASGTAYWLCLSAAGFGYDYQGDSGVILSVDSPANPLPATWTEDANVSDIAPIFWGEDAGIVPVNTPAFQAIPFMGGH